MSAEPRYDASFFEARTLGSVRSARFLLGRLFEVYKPKSVLDLGCGNGTWLMTAGNLGAKALKGYDGPWVKEDSLLSKDIDFSPIDFSTGLEVEGRFDLALCLELAEHLPEERGEDLVDALSAASDVVLFSAAVPSQGGEGHINERWQSDWCHHFEVRGFRCYDIFRGAAWHEPEVDWWYAQNAFLFVKGDAVPEAELAPLVEPPKNIAHPASYLGHALGGDDFHELKDRVENPNGKFMKELIRRYAKRQWGKMTGKGK